MSKSKAVGGVVAVGAVIGVKALLKVGFIAAIFGGAHVAETAYAASVTHVRDLATQFNAKSTDEQIQIDEPNRAIIHYVYLKDINSYDLQNVDREKLEAAKAEAKQELIKQYKGDQATTADVFLLNHEWREVVNWQTGDTHQTFTTFTVEGVDL